jgi:peptidoglycan/LPS O-acetylase OafA/YrhL
MLGVLIHHFGSNISPFFGYGTISVRVFFALSGYFITIWIWRATAVEEDRGVSAWKSLPNFHSRRLLRLAPALYLSLLFAVLWGMDGVLKSLPWHLLFASNFYVVHVGYWPPVVSHLWTISLQEQFYLLWPLFVLAVPRRFFPTLITVSILLALSYRTSCIIWEVSPVVRWTMLPGQIDSFAAGAAVAWLSSGKIGAQVLPADSKLRWCIVALGCLAVGRALRIFAGGSPWSSGIETLEAVFVAWIILRTSEGWGGWAGKLLGSPALSYLGRISLGIYLYHVLVHISLGPALDQMGLTASGHMHLRIVVLTVVTVAVASASWHFMELPMSRLMPSLSRIRTSG